MKKVTCFLAIALLMMMLVACSNSAENDKAEMVQISVERTGGLLTGIGKVKVYIDKREVMKVKNNQTETIALSLFPGTHTIQTKGQGDKSGVVKFEVVSGMDNSFHYNTEISNIYGVKLKLINYVETANQTEQEKVQAEETQEVTNDIVELIEEELTVLPENNVGASMDVEKDSNFDDSKRANKTQTDSIMSQIEDSRILYEYYDGFRSDYANAIEFIDFGYIEEYFKRGSVIASDYEKFVIDHHNMDDYNYEFLSNELYYYEFIDENTVNAFAREEFNFYSATDGGYYYNRDKRYIIKQENDQWYIEDIQIEDTVKEKI